MVFIIFFAGVLSRGVKGGGMSKNHSVSGKFLWKLKLPDDLPLKCNSRLRNEKCLLCRSASETREHLFLHWSFARSVWFAIDFSLRTSDLQIGSVDDWIADLCSRTSDSDSHLQGLEIRWIFLSLYLIWEHRNKVRDSKKEHPDPMQVVHEFKRWKRLIARIDTLSEKVTTKPPNFNFSCVSMFLPLHWYVRVRRICYGRRVLMKFDISVSYCNKPIWWLNRNLLMPFCGITKFLEGIKLGIKFIFDQQKISDPIQFPLHIVFDNKSQILMLQRIKIGSHLRHILDNIKTFASAFASWDFSIPRPLSS